MDGKHFKKEKDQNQKMPEWLAKAIIDLLVSAISGIAVEMFKQLFN